MRHLVSRTLSFLALLALVVGVFGCDGGESSSDTTEEESCGGSGVICTFMGDGISALGDDGLPPTEVSLYLPQDAAFGPDGMQYVLDWNNHRVRRVLDGLVETYIGTGELGDAPDGPALGASLNHPTHLSFSPTGKIILSAWHNSKLMEMDPATGELTRICGNGQRSFGGDGGPAIDAVLDLPVSTAWDSQGRLYIMDQANQRVRRIDGEGIISTVVGPPPDYIAEGYTELCVPGDDGEDVCKLCLEDEATDPECSPRKAFPNGFDGDDPKPGTDAFLHLPVTQNAPPAARIEMGPDETLYICDTGNQRIRALDSSGMIRTVAGSGSQEFDPNYFGGYGGDGGPATEALLQRPTDVAVASDGTFYIADTDNSCVRVVTPDGIIDTFAGECDGERGFAGDGGSPRDALLDRPYGVALDSDGNLYIADTHNHRIRVIYK